MSPTRRLFPRLALFATTLALLFSGWSIGGIGRAEDATPTSSAETSDPATATAPSEAATESTTGVTAGGGGGGTINNHVILKNFTDGRTTSRVGTGIAHVTGDSSQNQNAAVAASSCTDCRTVAVAVQIVLVQREDASTITPQNYAMAINQNCLRCQTFAAAYQYVVTTEGIVRFTAAGQQRLAAIENELRALVATDDIPFPELDARATALVHEMWAVVDSETALVGGRGVEHKDVDTEVEDSTASPTPSMTPTAAEFPATMEPSESPTSEPSTAPTESESPSPTPSTEPSRETPSPTSSPSP